MRPLCWVWRCSCCCRDAEARIAWSKGNQPRCVACAYKTMTGADSITALSCICDFQKLTWNLSAPLLTYSTFKLPACNQCTTDATLFTWWWLATEAKARLTSVAYWQHLLYVPTASVKSHRAVSFSISSAWASQVLLAASPVCLSSSITGIRFWKIFQELSKPKQTEKSLGQYIAWKARRENDNSGCGREYTFYNKLYIKRFTTFCIYQK